MDTRSDRGQFYPGGATSSVPAGDAADKVDRVDVGEIGASYTLKDVKNKVNQIVRVLAPAAVCLALCAGAATAPLEDIPNTAPVVTNEEDVVAMAAVGALGQAMSNRVEAAENSLQAGIAGATNAVVQAAISAAEAESNRVDATYAKRSEIPAAQDLTPYALKSELPTDYLRENDITNFATRSWISAQGYASSAEVGARIDAQDNAIAAQNAAIATASNALATAHAADVAALRRGTNELAQADARLDAKIDALELTGGMTRLWSSDATTYQDATGVVWQVHKDWLYTMSGTNYTAEQMGSNFDGGYLSWEEDFEYEGPYGTNEVFTGWFVNDGSGTSPLGYWNEDWSGATNANLTSAQYQFAMQQVVARRAFTNAVTRVAYTNDVAAAIVRLENEGTVRNAERLVDTMTGDSVTVVDVQQIAQAGTNYTDAVAAEFEDGTRTVVNANYAGTASDAMVAYKVSGDEWHDQYNANDLMRASTNAAKAVVAPAAVAATNYTDAATNALAQTIGGGGGMPEWREVNYDVEIDTVNYVTNGIASLTFVDAGYAYGLIVSTNGWPEGAAMFVRGSLRAGATYTVPNELRLIGYGTWPTNDFQSVWWRSGTNIFVNVLIEE